MNKTDHNINAMCKELRVTRSGYYSWLKRGKSEREKRNQWLEHKIWYIFNESCQRYGSPRITAELKSQGIRCTKKTVAKIMRTLGLKSKMKRRYKVTTNSKHKLPVSKNLVERKFNPSELNRLWVSDITYIRTLEGWLYLAVIIDLYSKTVVAWSASNKADADLVANTITKAIRSRKPGKELIFHSDRGVQYANIDVRSLLEQKEINQSMSSKGNCYDNAPAESFFSILKRELIYHVVYKTREEAKISLFEYIEIFYNRKRRHSAIGYMSPLEFENINKLA